MSGLIDDFTPKPVSSIFSGAYNFLRVLIVESGSPMQSIREE
jgi:hypothetical protein